MTTRVSPAIVRPLPGRNRGILSLAGRLGLFAFCLAMVVSAQPAWAEEPGSGSADNSRTATIDDAQDGSAYHGGRGELDIILIHGLGGAAEIWEPVIPFLKGTFNVWTFELTGHGRTQPVINPGIDTEVERLREFMSRESISYPVLVGHGVGGMIALRFALDYPANLSRLIVIDSAPRQMASDEQKQAISEAILADYDRFVASRYLDMSPKEDVTEQILDLALRTDSASFVSLLMSGFDFDVTDELKGLSVPLLVVGSELMFPAPETIQDVLNQVGYGKARSLSFKRIGQTGHYVMLERPVNTASVLLAFGVTPDHEFEH